MININKIRGHLGNGKHILIKKRYTKEGKIFEIDASFDIYLGKIKLGIRDYDVELDEQCGHGESEIPNKREEVKDFDTVEETVNYILKTTQLTEEDFPPKFRR